MFGPCKPIAFRKVGLKLLTTVTPALGARAGQTFPVSVSGHRENGCIFTRNLRFAYKLVRTSLYYHFHQKSNFNDVSSTHIAFLEHFRDRLFREFRFSAVKSILVQPNLPKPCVHHRLLLSSSLLSSMNTGKIEMATTEHYIQVFQSVFETENSRVSVF